MRHLVIVALAGCGAQTVRGGGALPPVIVQPNTQTFSAPRPLEDWLPPSVALVPGDLARGVAAIAGVAGPTIGVFTARPGPEAFTGIECQDWQPGHAELCDSDVTGAYVSRVAQGSPAEAAGLHGGEFILAWSGSLGVSHGGCAALQAFLHDELPVAPRVALSIWQPSLGEPVATQIAVPAAFGPLGITVSTLEHQDIEAPFVIATDQRAEHLGFRPGDLVVAVDDEPVRWRRDLHDALAAAGFPAQSRATTISIARTGAGRWVPMTITTARYSEVLP